MLHFNQIPAEGDAKGCVITLHGRGTNGRDLMPIAEEIALPHLDWVFPDAPLLFEGMPQAAMWFGSGAERAHDIQESRKSLFELIEYISVQKNLPTNKIALMGFSQGAVMSLDAGLHYKKRLATIVALSGFLSTPENLEAEKSEASAGLPIFLAHGTEDDIVNVSGSRQAKAVLLENGYAVALHEFPITHTINLPEIALVRSHLFTHLGDS